MIEWWILTEEEQAQDAIEYERQAVEEAERARLVQECKQATGHGWVLELEEPAVVDNSVQLRCVHCPAGVDDVYPDGFDLIYLDHGDVEVRGGMHNSPEPLTIPVTVEVLSGRIWTDWGWEYDAELVIEHREATDG